MRILTHTTLYSQTNSHFPIHSETERDRHMQETDYIFISIFFPINFLFPRKDYFCHIQPYMPRQTPIFPYTQRQTETDMQKTPYFHQHIQYSTIFPQSALYSHKQTNFPTYNHIMPNSYLSYTQRQIETAHVRDGLHIFINIFSRA